jgi:hypothetical protein
VDRLLQQLQQQHLLHFELCCQVWRRAPSKLKPGIMATSAVLVTI